MYFLGVDPSTKKTAFAVIDENKNVIYHSYLNGQPDDPEFFKELYTETENILNQYEIKGMVVEDQFMQRNADTLKKICRLTGPILTSAGFHFIPTRLLPPPTWRSLWRIESGIDAYDKKDSYKKKTTYCKEEIFYILQLYFPILENFKEDNDLADALGMAWVASQIHINNALPIGEIKKKKKKRKKRKAA